MIRRDFIGTDRNTIEKRANHFDRRLAAAGLKRENLSEKVFLHFESPNDMAFMSEFYELLRSKRRLEHTKENILPEFVFTHSKIHAINAHKKAKSENINVSTLVDMDWDVKDKQIKQYVGIHSTRYACTLLTIQFLMGDKELDLKYLNKVLKSIEVNLKDSQCSKIRETSIQRTWKRIERARGYAGENFKKQKVNQPLNDHSLAESIYFEIYDCEDENNLDKNIIKKYEKELKKTAMNDVNGKIEALLLKMLNDVR
jgi:hypothetical protein